MFHSTLKTILASRYHRTVSTTIICIVSGLKFQLLSHRQRSVQREIRNLNISVKVLRKNVEKGSRKENYRPVRISRECLDEAVVNVF